MKLTSLYEQLRYAAAFATLHWYQVDYLAKIHLEFPGYQLGEFLLPIAYFPAIEIIGFLIIVVEHLSQHAGVICIAKSLWLGKYPFSGLFLSSKVWQSLACVMVVHGLEVRLLRILPAIKILLCHTTTALGETGVTYFPLIHQYLSASLPDRFPYLGGSGFSDTLISLAMVIRANIEKRMVFTVIPTNQRVIPLDKREKVITLTRVLAPALHLGQ